MSFRRLRAMFVKELHHITRDALSLGMALAVPFMMLMLYGYALSLDVDHIPTMIYDQDRTPESRELIHKFQGSRYFDIRGYAAGYPDVERAINRNEILMGVTIPRNYAQDLSEGREAPVQLLIDGSDSNTASIALGYAERVVQSYSVTRTPPVDARVRVWYNSSLESKNYVVPGLIAVILQIIAALLTSLTIARERETGTMEQLMSTPLRPVEIVLGKMAAYFVIGVVDSAMAVLAALFIFDVPMRGSFLLLGGAVCLFLVGALFWGIFVSSIAKSQLEAYQLGLLSSFLPAFMLSGFVYSIETMPTVIQWISHIVPARYIVTIMKGVFLKGVGLSVLWYELLFLGIYASLVFLFSIRKMKQKVV
jgi:ABC-2 type transport system permease protein